MRSPNNDDIAQVLAKIAFSTEHKTLTDFQRFAVQLFVEKVALPKESESYTELEIKNYIVSFLSEVRD